MNTLPLEKMEEIQSIERNIYEIFEQAIARRPDVLQILLPENNYAHCMLNLSTITNASIDLAQIAWIVRENLQQAREYFSIPLSPDLEPNFGAVAKLVDEGLRGLRAWDGEKMSLMGQAEHLICYLLLNRTAEIAEEYAVFRQKELFIEYDLHSWRAIFARHLILASQGCYEEIKIEDYAKSKMKKNDFLHEAHTALIALAQGDETKFAQEMAACCEAFKKRKKSRIIDMTWGYGVASHFCFDIVGTALYRLAVQRGLQFPMPEQRYYPVEFWRD